MSTGADGVIALVGMFSDSEEYGVRFEGKVLPGRFSRSTEAAQHLAQLLTYKRTGECPIVLNEKTSPGPGHSIGETKA